MKFFDGFDDEAHVSRCFEEPESLDYEIIVAVYSQGSYDGQAYVLARKDGKLFEVEGGHCSCYGLEGQWNPSEVSIKYLLQRCANGRFCDDLSVEKMREVIEAL